MANKIIIGEDEPIPKGDTINLECTLGENISDWKIRAELYDDCGNCLRYATANVTGGSSDEIEVTDAVNGVFIIHILKDQTKNFDKIGFLEIEVETTNTPTEKFTIARGEDTEIRFRKQRIEWNSK
jgi:hypothetical protein